MGANAQTKVPTFASAEVLTAANQNLLSNGIPVFSGTATRNDAFGGSGEKVLAEGQFAYLEDSNTTQYYDGAAWQSVGVNPGLVFITGATFTTQTSISLPADTFSATYTNYLFTFYASTATAVADVSFRLRAAGTDNSSSNYYYAATGYNSANTATNIAQNGATSIGTVGMVTNYIASGSLNIMEPKTANKTAFNGTLSTNGNNTTSIAGVRTFAGIFDGTTSFDSWSILATAAISGSYKVYGYSNS
jgi:hypothetical protein